MRIGVVILPDATWQHARARWQLADRLGLDSAWTYDHLIWRERAGQPWFGAVPTLAAAAQCTEHIGLGTLVATPNFRNPVALAQDAMTLDDLAGGRLTLGLGAGSAGLDAALFGSDHWTAGARQRRFEEFVVVVKALLRTGSSTHGGEFYRHQDAELNPRRPGLPLAIAASGPAGIALAAAHADIWVTNGYQPVPGEPPRIEVEKLRQQSRLLSQACQQIGRDPGAIRRLVVDTTRTHPPLASVAAFDRAVERYAALGFTDLVVPMPTEGAPYPGRLGILEQVAGRLLSSSMSQR